MTTERALQLALTADNLAVGIAIDPIDHSRRLTIEILLDGVVVRSAHANLYAPELVARGFADPCHGFAVPLPAEIFEGAGILEARIANLRVPVGVSINLRQARDVSDDAPRSAELRWLGGLRFAGWIDTTTNAALEVLVDGTVVTQLKMERWGRIDVRKDGTGGRNVRAFDFHVPERFADGCVHEAYLRHIGGQLIPVAASFVAFADGLTSAAGIDSERLLAEMHDRLIPASLPLSAYVDWRHRFPLQVPPPSKLRIAVIVAGKGNASATLACLESQGHPHWVAGVFEGATLTLDATAIANFLGKEAAEANVVIFATAGTQFEPTALARFANAFDDNPTAIAAYGDLDLLAPDGQLCPLAFPAFDYERLLEQGYCAHLFALRRNLVDEAFSTRPNSFYRIFNALFDHEIGRREQVLHLPGALAILPSFDQRHAVELLAAATDLHLLARGINSKIASKTSDGIFPTIRVRRERSPGRTTIVIPTRDRITLLRACLDSIIPTLDRCDAEVLVVDNDSSDPETCDYLAHLPKQGIGLLRIEGPFNFARLNNIAVTAVDSAYVCLLNNDVEARDGTWLEELLGRLSEPDVGAVGALLNWPSGLVQHGGVVVGPNFAATHAFTNLLSDDPGYTGLLRTAHQCSAVTAACLLTRRADYLAVEGMDETRLAVAFNDVDYCLKLREMGRRIVFTPHARLIHHESVSRGADDLPDRRHRFERELNVLRDRWRSVLLEDPCYNPQLSLDGIPFSALAWPPRPRTPRFDARPKSRVLPPGF